MNDVDAAYEEARFLITEIFDHCPVWACRCEMAPDDGPTTVVCAALDRWIVNANDINDTNIADVGAFILGEIIARFGLNVRLLPQTA
jgi:hypothetical protein